MADREQGRSATITADLPGFDAESVLVSILNPIGTVLLDLAPAEALGQGRYLAAVPTMTLAGVYQDIWHDADGVEVQRGRFTVGPRPLASLTRFDLRIQVATRISKTLVGTIEDAPDGLIIDSDLLGGTGNYRSWWVMPSASHQDAGRVRRVVGFNGSGLTLSAPFPHTLLPGDRYLLTEIDPREVDRSIETAFADLSQIARIPIRIDAVPVTDFNAVIPDGLSYVHEVRSGATVLTRAQWALGPGRALGIDASLTDATVLNLAGVRDAEPPRWEDSLVEIDPGALVPGAVKILHASRAAGQAMDPKEHLRRQLATMDEYERNLRRAAGRVPSGARRVLE